MNVVPTEQQEAEALAAWLRVRRIPFTHTPNETGHSQEALRRAVRMKRAGVSKGFPDYTVFVGGKTVFLELKRRMGGRVSAEQAEWISILNGYNTHTVAIIAKGAREAISAIDGIARQAHNQ